VRIGVTGPANVATLLRFAVRCGVGNSMRVLSSRGAAMLRLLNEAAPDAIVRDLAAGAGAGEIDLHFFPFGGVAKAARWANAVRNRAFTIEAVGFRVEA